MSSVFQNHLDSVGKNLSQGEDYAGMVRNLTLDNLQKAAQDAADKKNKAAASVLDTINEVNNFSNTIGGFAGSYVAARESFNRVRNGIFQTKQIKKLGEKFNNINVNVNKNKTDNVDNVVNENNNESNNVPVRRGETEGSLRNNPASNDIDFDNINSYSDLKNRTSQIRDKYNNLSPEDQSEVDNRFDQANKQDIPSLKEARNLDEAGQQDVLNKVTENAKIKNSIIDDVANKPFSRDMPRERNINNRLKNLPDDLQEKAKKEAGQEDVYDYNKQEQILNKYESQASNQAPPAQSVQSTGGPDEDANVNTRPTTLQGNDDLEEDPSMFSLQEPKNISSSITQSATNTIEDGAEGVNELSGAADEAAAAGKNLLSGASAAADDAAEAGSKAASTLSKGASTASNVLSDLSEGSDVLDAATAATAEVPVVGEVIGGLAGLVGLGTQIANLFEKKPDAKPAPVAPAQVQVDPTAQASNFNLQDSAQSALTTITA